MFTLDKTKPNCHMCYDRWTWWSTRVQSKTWLWEMPLVMVPLLFFLFSLKWWRTPKKVCIEHLDQLIAAGPDIWTRLDRRKRPIYVIYLSGLYFLSEPCFFRLLCFACNIRRCFGNYEEQQHRNAGEIFLALVTCNVTCVVWTLSHNVWLHGFRLSYLSFITLDPSKM